MRRLAMVAAIAVGLAGCAVGDDARTDIIEVDDEVRCAVVRDGMGRIQFLDCDWEDR